MMGTLLLGAMMLVSCTVSQNQADAYNNLIDVAGVLLSEEDAAKLNTADAIIGAVTTVETEDTK